MTDTPDKEWIERADKIVPYLGAEHAGRMLIVLRLARELQSSFDQGVERERARQDALRTAVFVLDESVIDALTPTPTEGERG